MTLMKAGFLALITGITLIRRARPERRAIGAALSRRLRTGLGLVLGGIALVAVGARIQGQILFRRWKRTHQAEIDALRGLFDRLKPMVEPLIESARRR